MSMGGEQLLAAVLSTIIIVIVALAVALARTREKIARLETKIEELYRLTHASKEVER